MIVVRNNRFYILLGLALLLLGVLFLYLRVQTPPHSAATTLDFTDGTLVSGDIRIAVKIAQSEAERAEGLSGTESLPADTGMLFVFETAGRHGFWMKDMHYDLDIIWLDQEMRVVDLTLAATPASYPHIFYPSDDILYALEVPSGFSTLHALKRGQTFTLHK